MHFYILCIYIISYKNELFLQENKDIFIKRRPKIDGGSYIQKVF